MTDIINLRRARKNKARAAKAAKADANRATHGVPKSVRDLAKAQREKAKRTADAHKLDEQ